MLKGPVINFFGPSNVPLLLKELGVVEPDFRHLTHVDQAALVQIVDDVVECSLLNQVELLNVHAGFFQEIIPHLIAAWQVLKRAFVKFGPLFILLKGCGLNGVPPLLERVAVAKV